MGDRIPVGKKIDNEDDKSNYSSYVADDENDIEEDDPWSSSSSSTSRKSINASRELLDSTIDHGTDVDITGRYREQFGSGLVNTRIADRENEVS